MSSTVFRKHLTDNRRGFLGWALAITAVAAMYSSMWPVLGRNSSLSSAINSFPTAMRDAFHLQDYGTAAGYFGSTVFGLLVPILLAVFAVAAGTKSIAGDEEAGTLDLVLAHPVRRVRLAAARWLAVLAAIVLVGVVLLLVELAIRVPAEFTTISTANLAAMTFQLVLFGCCFASIAFGIGAYTGRRLYAVVGGAYATVASYLCDSFLPQINGLHWVQAISPFSWYLGGDPLRNGIQWTHCALLAGLSLCCAAVGIRGFDRRDVAQGG
ncbi:ABC transporter permease subunit [Kitasatospora sp. GAS204B]|uniref:ABC transporter permease subunit n=1 Tax=unclassified Kitasatospora TaxID=2633591 RepID=UPI00247361A8|nr:ABC transporter permease subunit [Kitasatospora sp. GAS204B]MDH6119951.1 ABC-2 type transport system permease protein [Kitasatospora sp. GAS204B]